MAVTLGSDMVPQLFRSTDFKGGTTFKWALHNLNTCTRLNMLVAICIGKLHLAAISHAPELNRVKKFNAEYLWCDASEDLLAIQAFFVFGIV